MLSQATDSLIIGASSRSLTTDPSRHIALVHEKADGWVAMAKKEDGIFRQHHYQIADLQEQLREWTGEDVYFTQNTFYRPGRRVENIRQLRSLYVDIDCHNMDMEPEWALAKIEIELFGQSVPEPNIIVFSGRGFNCIWFLEPLPHMALPRWQAVENYLVEQLKYVGADSKAKDAARILRIAGSQNSKSGRTVAVQYRHNHRYQLDQIQADYLPELKPRTGKKTKEKTKGRPNKLTHMFNVHSLNYARLHDLVKLVEIRNYDMGQCHEYTCFLYRYWSCCFLDDPDEALRHTLELNSEFKKPMRKNQVIRATRSAERAYEARKNEEANRIARENGYPGAGYNLTNETIIGWLDISEDEQRHMKTLIGKTEHNRRKKLANQKMRREQGRATRDAYLENQKDVTDDKVWQLQKAIERHPQFSNVKLGELLGVSEGYIRKLKKQL